MKRAPYDGLESAAGILGFLAILWLVVIGTPWLMECPVFKSLGWIRQTILAVVALFTAFLFFLFGPFRESVVRVLDRMYWSLVDYGTSTRRLMAVIVILAIPTFALVALNYRNFEPTAAVYLATEASNASGPLESEQAATDGKPEDQRNDGAFFDPCTEKNWRAGEAFWMTLRYHIPLAALGVMDKCQPTDEYLYIAGREMSYIEPRDWFGTMAILNYILWPLFIPFLIRRFWRVERQG